MLTVRFTLISPTHHRFAYVRADGSGESQDFETRSTLRHDLLHFAYETEAGLTNSFYGLLAKGATFAELAGKGMEAYAPGEEIGMTERIVGPLSGVTNGEVEPYAFLTGVTRFLEAQGERLPAFLTEALIARVRDRYRRLYGQWKATPFGETLSLDFSPRRLN
jgi:hypothetical protein